ncbi:MAG: chromate transporter [Velocimicrobium sp.]
MIYWELFLSFFQVGLFSFGGGLAALPLIKEQVVVIHPWLSLTEFSDLITIAQMTPGPIAINSATFVGIRIAGIGGALIATLGCLTPSIIIVSILAWLYFKFKNLSIIQGVLSGLRPAVVALIASAGMSIFILALWGEGGFTAKAGGINGYEFLVFLVALLVLRIYKPSPILVMVMTGIVGGLIHIFL